MISRGLHSGLAGVFVFILAADGCQATGEQIAKDAATNILEGVAPGPSPSTQAEGAKAVYETDKQVDKAARRNLKFFAESYCDGDLSLEEAVDGAWATDTVRTAARSDRSKAREWIQSYCNKGSGGGYTTGSSGSTGSSGYTN